MRALWLVVLTGSAFGCAPDPVGRVPLPTCPDQMVHLADLGVCIDRFEASTEGEGQHAATVSVEGQIPRTDIAWAEAGRACAQAGFRLCTAREWQRACAGDPSDEAGRPYPYGEEFESERCNSTPDDGVAVGRVLARTGQYARCVSPEGVHDLSGNVGEWVEDATHANGGLRQTRGGNFSSYQRYAKCVDTPLSQSRIDFRSAVLGFRCCTDAR